MLSVVFGVVGCAFACLLSLFLISRRKIYSIKGKHVMITGGSSGIGKSLAADAIKKGAAVVTLVARNKGRLNAAKEELEKLIQGGSQQCVHVLAVDVSCVEVKEAIAGIVEEVAPIDILINCAGITFTGTMLETPPEKYQELLGVNLLGSVYPTLALLPSMVSRKSGAIVFISSQAGQLGLYGYSAYSATKFGLRGLAEVLHMELKPHNIHVSISFPPDTDTPQLREEVPLRGSIQTELAAFGTVFQPHDIARDIWEGVERGVFQITHGLDGFILGTVGAGTSPINNWLDAMLQVLLMGAFRGVGVVYLMLFNRVVARGNKNLEKMK